MSGRAFQLALLVGMLLACEQASADDVKPQSGSGTTDSAEKPSEGFATIHNDFFWVDQNGNRILTRSGCLCQFGDTFYWYGGNPRGFREQNCYTSSDLVHWTNRGVVLRHEPDANRIDVLYNQTTHEYVMFLKYDG